MTLCAQPAIIFADIVQIEPDMREADGMIYGIALRGPGAAQINTDVKVAWRVLGWGDPSKP